MFDRLGSCHDRSLRYLRASVACTATGTAALRAVADGKIHFLLRERRMCAGLRAPGVILHILIQSARPARSDRWTTRVRLSTPIGFLGAHVGRAIQAKPFGA